MWFSVEQHPVQQVTALFAVLEEHQRRHTHDGHEILEHHVHGQAEHLTVQKPAEDVHHDCDCQDGEEVFRFEPKECDPGPQVSVDRCDIECHFCLLTKPSNPLSDEKLSQTKQPRNHQA